MVTDIRITANVVHHNRRSGLKGHHSTFCVSLSGSCYPLDLIHPLTVFQDRFLIDEIHFSLPLFV